METKQNILWEGEPVLSYSMELPRGPERCRRLARYLARTEQVWGNYWEKRTAPAACEALRAQRERGGSFTPWTARLTGEVTLETEELFSMKLEAREVHGDGRPCLVCWGEIWDVERDAPLNVENLYPAGKGWENRVLERIFCQGEAGSRGNLWVPAKNWRERVKNTLKRRSPWVDEKRVFWSFPQGFIADPAEGTPVFETEREDMVGTSGRNRNFP